MTFFKKVPLQLAIASTLATSVTAIAAEQTTDNTVQDVEVISVTGTRRSLRSISESTVPVDLLTSRDLSSTGQLDMSQVLASQLPSFNYPSATIADGTDHAKPAVLRGLAPDHTLVLINGKRRHAGALLNLNGTVGRGSTAVDLNNIPTSAIKRVEILRDGAAAQYGSDAIAGVINIVLKDADEGGAGQGAAVDMPEIRICQYLAQKTQGFLFTKPFGLGQVFTKYPFRHELASAGLIGRSVPGVSGLLALL